MVRYSESGLGGMGSIPLTALSARVLKYLGRSLHDNLLVFLVP